MFNNTEIDKGQMSDEEQSALKALLEGMLKWNPVERIASKQALQSEWFTKWGHPEMLRLLNSPPEIEESTAQQEPEQPKAVMPHAELVQASAYALLRSFNAEGIPNSVNTIVAPAVQREAEETNPSIPHTELVQASAYTLLSMLNSPKKIVAPTAQKKPEQTKPAMANAELVQASAYALLGSLNPDQPESSQPSNPTRQESQNFFGRVWHGLNDLGHRRKHQK
jgi:serine/threonine protein kinase